MRYLNFKKKKIFLLLYISILVVSSIGSINTFYKFTEIESISSDNYTENDLNTAETFIYTLNGKKYLAEYITREKVKEMKEQIGVRDPNKNYNQIIDGYGTGFAPPTEKDYENLVGQISIINLLPEPHPQAPEAVQDLSTQIYFPIVGDQGSQGSCAAWAMTYYAYGYLEAKDNGWDASSGNPDYLMSPAWTYNKVVSSGSGSWMIENGEILEEWGCTTLSTMPYDDTDIHNWGNETAWREAPYHRVYETYLMDFDEVTPDTTIDMIKSLVDGETPVTFALDANQFDDGLTDNYIISSAEYSSSTINHAQCIVGYNDSVAEDGDVGAFRVVNSWGDYYLMDGGYYWLTYETLKEIGLTMGDWNLHLCYVEDLINYEPELIATWEFNPAPTRMDDIITLGVGPHDVPLDIITPLYESDINNLFPEFMALDISEFQSYYDFNNDVLFYLELGSSNTPGIISSFRIERYISGVLQEITSESPDIPRTTPGYVYGTFMDLDHDLEVDLEVPTNPEIDKTYIINATVTNTGSNIETDVDLFLYLDSEQENYTRVLTLPVGTNDTINYVWTPTEYKTYNFTAYAPPVPSESFTSNNILTELIILRDAIFFEDFESGLSQWDTISGLWHLTDDGSAWPDPYHSPTHSMWFGNEATGNYDTGSHEMGNLTSVPINLSSIKNATLEFYHWKETEQSSPYDASKVYISTDSVNWDTIYEDYNNIAPWEKVSLNISKYVGNSSVQLRFFFDTTDNLYNDYRGWLVDDIEILGTRCDPPGEFILTSNAGTPDKDGMFNLTWSSANEAHNYSVYQHTSYISEINGSLTLLVDETEDLTHPLSGYSDGTYYFIVIANNTYGGTLSNCIEVVVEIGPPGDFILLSNAGTPDDNGAFDLTWTSAEAALNYSVYRYFEFITEINGSLTLLANGTEDLTLPLSGYLDGTYYFVVVANNTYGGTLSNCIEVVVQIPQPTPPGSFVLSSNAGTPDNNGAFDLTWTSAAGAVSYSVYEYSSYITEINGSLTLMVAGTTNLTISLSGYSNGTYYFITVAYNAIGNTLSNCLEIVVQIPPEPDPEPTPSVIPGYNIFIFVPIILVAVMVIIRKQHKKRSEY